MKCENYIHPIIIGFIYAQFKSRIRKIMIITTQNIICKYILYPYSNFYYINNSPKKHQSNDIQKAQKYYLNYSKKKHESLRILRQDYGHIQRLNILNSCETVLQWFGPEWKTISLYQYGARLLRRSSFIFVPFSFRSWGFYFFENCIRIIAPGMK